MDAVSYAYSHMCIYIHTKPVSHTYSHTYICIPTQSQTDTLCNSLAGNMMAENFFPTSPPRAMQATAANRLNTDNLPLHIHLYIHTHTRRHISLLSICGEVAAAAVASLSSHKYLHKANGAACL